MFDMKRPCKSCPFRKGFGERFGLCQDRIDEIVNANSFQCHQTVDYDAMELDDEGERIGGDWQGDNPQQCVGLMTVLHREGMDNQIMQVAQRLGALDPSTLDPKNECYESLEEALEAHARS